MGGFAIYHQQGVQRGRDYLHFAQREHAGDLLEDQLELMNKPHRRKDEVNILNQLGKLKLVMHRYEEAETCHAQQQNLAHNISTTLGR